MNRRGRISAAAPFLLALGAVALFLALGHRHLHHWDEPVYLYAASHYTPAQLAQGEFEPGNIPGFFAAKIGHAMLLRLLVGLFGTGLAAVLSIQAAYTILAIFTWVMLAGFIWLLWGDARHALAVGLLSLLMPLSVYLGPKLLSEVPAMFGASAGLLAFALALRAGRSAGVACWLIMSACALAYGFLARQTILLLVGGAWLALWVVMPQGLRRGRVVLTATVVCVLAAGLVVAIHAALGHTLPRAIGSAEALSAVNSSWTLMAKRVGLTFGPSLLAVPLSLVTRRRPLLGFYSLWLAGSLLPLAAVLRHVEERFLVTGLPALAGLAVLGGEVVWRWLGRWQTKPAVPVAAGVAAALVLAGSNLLIQPKTAYGLHQGAIDRMMRWLEETHPGEPVVVARAICDYHFLRMAYPEAPVYVADTSLLLATASAEAIAQGRVRRWGETDLMPIDVDPARWYGDRYIGDLAALERLAPFPWLYMTSRRDLPYSWIDENPRLRLTQLSRHRGYRVYRVEKSTLAQSTASEVALR